MHKIVSLLGSAIAAICSLVAGVACWISNLIISFVSWIYAVAIGVLGFLSKADFNNAFLSDIAAFEGVAMGILLPLAWESISRTAEKYGDIITVKFKKHFVVRVLPYSYAMHIVLAIGTRLASSESNLASPGGKLWGALLFIWFLFNLIVFVSYLNIIHLYTFDIRKILDGLFEDAYAAFKNR